MSVRAELIEIWEWEKADKERELMVFRQNVASAAAALRGYEFEWLPRATLLEWARAAIARSMDAGSEQQWSARYAQKENDGALH